MVAIFDLSDRQSVEERLALSGANPGSLPPGSTELERGEVEDEQRSE
jgi:hypothetical protein